MSKNAVVIGASSGIGFALTQALLERSIAVGACSRHLEPLQTLQERFSEERCVLRRMDVTELDEDSRKLEALIRRPSTAFANAGKGVWLAVDFNGDLFSNTGLSRTKKRAKPDIEQNRIFSKLPCSEKKGSRRPGLDSGFVLLKRPCAFHDFEVPDRLAL